ncbi:MAG: amino acid ABC transporter permease [Erysipelotrichaceae bacterium]|nr:amino acid ABC transporter permease [Erysipelotrichaceae bacterium]
MTIDFTILVSVFKRNWPLFEHGIKITCIFAVIGTVCGLLIGIITGAIRTMKTDEDDSMLKKILVTFGILFTRFYIWVFRGTPMVVQATFIYYLLRPVFHWNTTTASLIIISVNTGAYMAEIVRAGIQSVNEGQLEASRALGMSYGQALFHIIMPQAIKNTFPSIGNQLIVNIKDSSMLNVLSVTELFFQTYSIAGSNFRYIETYFISAIIYLLLTSVASFILNRMEKRMDIENNAKIMEYAS